MTRDYDVVVLGASGFTGGLTADHLAARAPAGLRWAVAGRRRSALEEMSAERWGGVPVVEADTTDAASLAALAASTRVLVTTVGPYLRHGEPVVAACAEAGTDYVDLTGEPEFVDRVYLAHHETARRTGARIVHACGFDSVPHDLGVYHALRELAGGVDGFGGGLQEPVRVRGVVRTNATFSGGTFHSALGQVSRPRQVREAHRARRRVEPRPQGRRVRAVAGRPGRDPLLGYWLLPLPTIDPAVVVRSAAALPAYGPDVTYSHYAGTRTLRYAAGGVAGVAALLVAAQVGPLRRRLEQRVPSGAGPSERRRERSWFSVDVVAETPTRIVHTRVLGGDPGYTETARMLGESALCLALDDNPPSAGSVTTAAAMGEALLARLQAVGLRFEVVARSS